MSCSEEKVEANGTGFSAEFFGSQSVEMLAFLPGKQKSKCWQLLDGAWHLSGSLFLNPYDFKSTMEILKCCCAPVHKNAWRKPNGPDFSLRRHRSTFHRFLKMLACFDGLVVTCIFLMYALPVMCATYKKVKHFFLHTQRCYYVKNFGGAYTYKEIICIL